MCHPQGRVWFGRSGPAFFVFPAFRSHPFYGKSSAAGIRRAGVLFALPGGAERLNDDAAALIAATERFP